MICNDPFGWFDLQLQVHSKEDSVGRTKMLIFLSSFPPFIVKSGGMLVEHRKKESIYSPLLCFENHIKLA